MKVPGSSRKPSLKTLYALASPALRVPRLVKITTKPVRMICPHALRRRLSGAGGARTYKEARAPATVRSECRAC